MNDCTDITLANMPARIAIADIIEERYRQIDVEGWTTTHDDTHEKGEMAYAAAAYACHSVNQLPAARPAMWPWAPEYWKPAGSRRDLVKAAALIVAEIERLDRQQLVPLPVKRDLHGFWTHPGYAKFCNGREHIDTDEFDTWLAANHLQMKVSWRDMPLDEVADEDDYDISPWQPGKPEGDGWFIASIHDTEDGAVCIWLRNVEDSASEEGMLRPGKM